MNVRWWLEIGCAAILSSAHASAMGTGMPPIAPDGLVKVSSGRFDDLYLRPDVDFRRYAKVMLAPAQVALADRWLKDMNADKIAILQGTSPRQAEGVVADVRTDFDKALAGAFQKAGYETAAEPAVDVLAVSAHLTDVYVYAPASVTLALPSRVYTTTAGYATLSLDIRDAATGTLLAHITDRRTAGLRGRFPNPYAVTSPVTNRFEFTRLFDDWLRDCVSAVRALDARTPMAATITGPGAVAPGLLR